MKPESGHQTKSLQDRWDEMSKQSGQIEKTQRLIDDLQVRDAIERQDDHARKATRERLNEVYANHSRRGLLGTGATLLVVVAVFEDEAKSFIANLVREILPLTRTAGAFDQIQEAVGRFLSLFEGELESVVRKVDDAIQDTSKLDEFSEAAEIIWAEKRAALDELLQRHRSEFVVASSEEVSEGLVPTQTCLLCRHWEPMAEGPECHSGLCRRFALGPSDNGWSITEADDGCDEWSGEGFFKGEDETIHADRRAFERTRVDRPARLSTPGGDWTGTLVDLSEKGARLHLANPPRVGASAMLKWDSYEYFCDIAWANEGTCGVTFAESLPDAVLFETKGGKHEAVGPVADPRHIAAGTKRLSFNIQLPSPDDKG